MTTKAEGWVCLFVAALLVWSAAQAASVRRLARDTGELRAQADQILADRENLLEGVELPRMVV